MPAIAGTAVQKFTALGVSVQVVAQNMTALAQAAAAAAPAMTNLQKAMQATSSFAQALRDLMEGSGWRATQGGSQSPEQVRQTQEVINKLKDLEARLQGVFGTNNQFAQLIDRNVKNIEAGGDPAAALDVLRAIFGAYGPGLQQEALSTDPAIRALALELEQFVNSGRLT